MLYINEMRGGIVEAKHKVNATVYHNGKLELQVGNKELVTPMRSTAKPFMLYPLLTSCAQNGIHLTDAQISVMSSSHNGELVHRETVLSILNLSQSDVTDLSCGTHLPYFDWLYKDYFLEQNILKRQLYHNCSGKHAGMLLLAKLNGFEKKNYWKIEHPVQHAIYSFVNSLFDCKNTERIISVLDGCGVPTYCVPIKKIALAYQALYHDERLLPVAKSILAEPYFIAGKNRIETDIISCCGYIAKSGSSGLFAVACPSHDISIALKIEDGNDDAAEVAIVEILDKLGLLNEQQRMILKRYKEAPIYTSTKLPAGMFLPDWINDHE